MNDPKDESPKTPPLRRFDLPRTLPPNLPPEICYREAIERQRALISEVMPTGTHEVRALAWSVLANRCAKAAEAHQAAADRQRATRAYVQQFRPADRETELQFAIEAGRL
jgi:hypothetical protein